MAETNPKGRNAGRLALYGVGALLGAILSFYLQGRMDVLTGEWKISYGGWFLVGIAALCFLGSVMELFSSGPKKPS